MNFFKDQTDSKVCQAVFAQNLGAKLDYLSKLLMHYNSKPIRITELIRKEEIYYFEHLCGAVCFLTSGGQFNTAEIYVLNHDLYIRNYFDTSNCVNNSLYLLRADDATAIGDEVLGYLERNGML